MRWYTESVVLSLKFDSFAALWADKERMNILINRVILKEKFFIQKTGRLLEARDLSGMIYIWLYFPSNNRIRRIHRLDIVDSLSFSRDIPEPPSHRKTFSRIPGLPWVASYPP
jgi:hypothetical protein